MDDILKEFFPKELYDEVQVVERLINTCDSVISEPITKRHYKYILLNGEKIEIPERIYYEEADESEVSQLSQTSQMIYHCIFSRSHNGYVRMKHIESLLSSELTFWVLPYVVKICDEYVEEILQLVWEKINDRDNSWFKAFCGLNILECKCNYDRMIAYWNCYYRKKCSDYHDYVGYRIFMKCFGFEEFAKAKTIWEVEKLLPRVYINGECMDYKVIIGDFRMLGK